MPAPGKTRNAKTKSYRKAKGTRKNTSRKSSRSRKVLGGGAPYNSIYAQRLRQAKKLFGPTTEYLTVAFAEDCIKDKNTVMGIDSQGWNSMEAKDLQEITFLGFGKDTMMNEKDLSPELTDKKQTLHYLTNNKETWAYPSGNSLNPKEDTLCYGGSCNPIFVVE